MRRWIAFTVLLALGAVVTRADARSMHITLTVGKAGSGSGRVTSAPAYIDCGVVCSALIPSISEVGGGPISLKATPDAGSVFTGWAGACSGSARTCTIEPDDTTTVTAIFDLQGTQTSYGLAVGKTGNGVVTSSPDGVSCGPTCTASFPSGTTVTLSATPALGWTFAGWSGSCSGADTCTVVLDGPKSVSARFVQETQQSFPLAVGKTGDGIVTSAPAGIDCGSSCSASFPSGTSVTLTAAPGTGATFAGWSGACSGTGPCTITIDGPKTVSANFGAGASQTVPLAVTRTGTGGVRSVPAGIDCPSACSAAFDNGTTVTLTATPQTGWTFAGWGGACSGTGTCSLVFDAPKAVTASFTQAPSFPLAVSKSGSGTVGSNPAGIDCGTSCSGSFRDGTRVTLIAVPAGGAVFAGWTGACEGSGETCVLVMSDAKSTTALFRENADTVAPIVKALASSGQRGARAKLRYRASDAGGQTRQTVTVQRGSKVLATVQTGLVAVSPTVGTVSWSVPRTLKRGLLRFCIRATDKAGNRSRASCAPLRIT